MAVLLSRVPTPRAPVDPDSSEEAVAWFRARVPLRKGLWARLSDAARRRAFTVAGATSADLLAQVWHAIDRAVAAGTDFTQFKRDAAAALRSSWAGDSPGRLETVFRNNVQAAYAAGRFAQSTDPDVLAARPYWRFEAILDGRTTQTCAPLDGYTALAQSAFWRTHYPPLHHNCRSGVATLTPAQAAAQGVTDTSRATDPAPGWGTTPDLGEWSPDPESYPAELRAALARDGV